MENSNEFRENQYLGNPQTALPNSTAVLVLGIVSIVGCFCYGVVGFICSIISMVLYSKDNKLYQQNPQSFTAASYSNLKAGRVCAIIGLILSSMYVLIIIVLLVIFGAAFLSNPQEIINHMR